MHKGVLLRDVLKPTPAGGRERSRPRALGPADAVIAATQTYLRGEQLDMSALATELGIGRATLYRWVGNREDLLATVLADGVERTYRTAVRGAQGQGPVLVLDSLRRFMHSMLVTPALRAMTQREPLLFLRLVTLPGAIEGRTSQLVADLLEQEAAEGRIRLKLPAPVLARALIRICDAHLYAYLVGHNDPEIESALELMAMLLGAYPAV